MSSPAPATPRAQTLLGARAAPKAAPASPTHGGGTAPLARCGWQPPPWWRAKTAPNKVSEQAAALSGPIGGARHPDRCRSPPPSPPRQAARPTAAAARSCAPSVPRAMRKDTTPRMSSRTLKARARRGGASARAALALAAGAAADGLVDARARVGCPAGSVLECLSCDDFLNCAANKDGTPKCSAHGCTRSVLCRGAHRVLHSALAHSRPRALDPVLPSPAAPLLVQLLAPLHQGTPRGPGASAPAHRLLGRDVVVRGQGAQLPGGVVQDWPRLHKVSAPWGCAHAHGRARARTLPRARWLTQPALGVPTQVPRR